jgi:acyl dehydratase
MDSRFVSDRSWKPTILQERVFDGAEVPKPLKAGDTLDCDSYLHSIRQARGTDIIVTKNIVTNQDGELVQETYTTRAARSDDDGEQGFSGATS